MKKSRFKIISLVAIALLCMVITTLIAFANDNSAPVKITVNGENTEGIIIDKYDKQTLKAEADLEGKLSYQWQIFANTPGADWVDIRGKDKNTCDVTYALVANLLDSANETQIRCVVSDGAESYLSEHVRVSVLYDLDYSSRSSMRFGMTRQIAEPANEAPANDEIKELYNITINYIFKDNTIARDPDTLSIAAGTSAHHTITAPVVTGYTPTLLESYEHVTITEEVLANGTKNYYVNLDFDEVDEPKIINVVYVPALVKYTVHHHRQNLLDDNYESDPFLTVELEGYTGEPIPDSHIDIEGFHALYYERMEVAANGKTQVEIYYDRDYYLVNFDLSGGFGVEPIYTRYGSEIGVNVPTKPGYDFKGWTLTSVGGRAPTAEEINKYNFTDAQSHVIIENALTYTANWVEGHTTYTMVFWQENANDDGYSYWASMIVDEDEKGDPLYVGESVSAKDWVSKVSSIDDEAYFTFNPERSDGEKTLKGDGTTIINVYYTRNRYTISFNAKGKCTLDEKHVHTAECYHDVCGKQHVHTDECIRNLVCTVPEHAEHTSDCIVCGIEEHIHGVHCSGVYSCAKSEHTHSKDCCTLSEHTHSKDCYPNVGSAVNSPATSGFPDYHKFPNNPKDGYIARFQQTSWMGGRIYHYIYIDGTWYNYSGTANNGTVIGMSCGLTEHAHGNGSSCIHCGIEEHTHNSSCVDCKIEEHIHNEGCYKDKIHTHTEECYEYVGCEEHVHEDSCLLLTCAMPTGHTHTSTCTNASRESTVKLVTRKYQQTLSDIWPIVDDNGVSYDNGERWTPKDSSYYSAVLVYIADMPADDFSLTVDTSSYETFHMHYMLEVLPGEEYTKTFNGKRFKEEFVVNANYNYITRDEDFFDIKGFEQFGSDPAFSSNKIDKNGGDVYFYYQRKTGGNVIFKFQNINTVVKSYTGGNIMYGASLKDYQYQDGALYVPPYPDVYEKNAYVFDRWFTTPECFPGTEVDWDNLTMPDGALTIYAHWVPVKHNVNIYKDASLSELLATVPDVEHGNLIPDPGHPTNGNYIFSGWFYKDDNGVEKAFVFNAIPIKDSINIYAKWGSRVAVQYKLYYKILNEDGSETEIAAPTVGSTIAGINRTFDAKGGVDLYEGYREGYFPDTQNYSIIMSAEGENEHTFYYFKRPYVPYRVEYVDKSGNEIHPTKIVDDNSFSVVTETFEHIQGYVPDSYQKRLVISLEQDANVIRFVYEPDVTHAFYRVVHYWQNLDGQYVEHSHTDIKATIGAICAAGPVSIDGFTFKEARLNGVTVSLNAQGTVSSALPANGMIIEFFYLRDEVDYTVNYVDEHGNNIVFPADFEFNNPETKHALYGAVVEEIALDLTALGYARDGSSVQRITLKESGKNNITFVYRENLVSYKYVALMGDILNESYDSDSNVGVKSGNPEGCEPFILADYTFVGWFVDAACTIPVDPAVHPVELGENNRLTPKKSDSDGNGIYLHEGGIYYAKYDYNFTNISIKVDGEVDADQIFMFMVEGVGGPALGYRGMVTVSGNGTAIITELLVGVYRISEITDWSWRYVVNGETIQEVEAYGQSGGSVVFVQSESNDKWLDGNGYSQFLIP